VDLDEQSTQSRILTYLMNDFKLVQNVIGPTRVTKDTKSCIDHVYSDFHNGKHIKVDIKHTGISDHYAQIVDVKA